MKYYRFYKNNFESLPTKPGVYKFINKQDIIIYVGKAKNLKKRVGSYFSNPNKHNRKTLRLINEIYQIEFVIVESEFDALLLENNLIKNFQPKYNILLKDDKTYPSICITKERFPRIFSTRNINHNTGEFFGPYANVKAMNSLLKYIHQSNHIRTCKYNLSEENISKKKFKVCLEYHIGNCKGPCEGFQTEDDYLNDIIDVKNILKGNFSEVQKIYKHSMNETSQKMQFEIANDYKKKLNLLAQFQAKSVIVNQKIKNTDVFTIISTDKTAYVNYMEVNHGAIINSNMLEIKKQLNESDAEILIFVICDMRKKNNSIHSNIITNINIEFPNKDIHITTPQISDKKKLIDLSLKNTLFFKKEKLSRKIRNDEDNNLKELQGILKLPNIPNHIECFDNSNIQGTNPVASMVCFKNGKPSKSNYRKYNIKTVIGADDFASMKEIILRRYQRVITEKLNYPNLIIVDGGKGQLSAACNALKQLNIYGKIPIIGLAKRLEEIYFPNDSIPYYISKKSSVLKLIQYIRDEAHRFAIQFHRVKRDKIHTNSNLDKINGIGEKTKMKLLKKYKSFKRINEASFDELSKLIGKSKAKNLVDYIKKEDK